MFRSTNARHTVHRLIPLYVPLPLLSRASNTDLLSQDSFATPSYFTTSLTGIAMIGFTGSLSAEQRPLTSHFCLSFLCISDLYRYDQPSLKVLQTFSYNPAYG
ncbi:hypothetical protein AVEN_637-1 [Araneus ventricosus]|uniref:Uncharacterized protein n=1 Tax=Araneus ventricosus TaxID=182803 RepID=A0A4Y2EIR2_ARAVE|nr:hypothetical protein AVEN_637-1 [Araneus ventricosus]